MLTQVFQHYFGRQVRHKNKSVTLLISALCTLGLIGCGGSSSTQSDQNPVQPPIEVPDDQDKEPSIIEDISCSVSYPLTIASAYTTDSSTPITEIFDRAKTDDSSWKAPSLDSKLIIELSKAALVKDMVITWKSSDYSHLFNIYASKDKEDWQLLNTVTQSEKNTLIPDLVHLAASDEQAPTALYIQLELAGNEVSQASEILEVEVFGCQQEVSHSIELIDWYLSVPTDEDSNGKSDSIWEQDLANGYFDPRFFSLTEDGGLLFSTSVSGYKTSTNTKYVRSELREMLRRGDKSHKTQGVNKNNWVFSSAPQSDLDNAGGVDGSLKVNMAVNQVTTTGEDYQIGRVVIGQIHANDDEPARLYYRKLPNNVNGSVYLAHEIRNGDDIYYEIIGSKSNSAANPDNGIPLNEKFSYAIDVTGNDLVVTITKADGSEHKTSVDMTDTGYNQGGQYMYFKAGVYHLNNSGEQHDYVQATFYQIDNSHTGYNASSN